MGKSIIPIGMSMGVSMTSPTEGTFDVLVGDDLKELGPEEWTFWGLAHEELQAHYEHRFDRAAFAKVIDEAQPNMLKFDKQKIVDKLFEEGVLVDVDLKGESPELFFRKYTMIPTARSFGNTVEDQTTFGIGTGTEPEIWFSGWSQMVWALSHRDGSMWRTCELIAEAQSSSPQEVAAQFASVLPVVVASGCGYLEPAK